MSDEVFEAQMIGVTSFKDRARDALLEARQFLRGTHQADKEREGSLLDVINPAIRLGHKYGSGAAGINPDCKRCLTLDLDRCENIAAGCAPDHVESPCAACGITKE
jgi:hypothetical protein